MLYYEFFSHLVISLIYLLIISFFKIGRFNTGDYLLLWTGGLVGTYFLDIDHLIYVFLRRPNEVSGLKTKELLKKKDYKRAVIYFANTHFERNELSFHNAIFIPIWIIFCFFILTSADSIFAPGLVMTMYLHLLKDIWDVVRIEKSYNLLFLFWQIKKPLEERIKKYYVWGITVVFVLENFLFLR